MITRNSIKGFITGIIVTSIIFTSVNAVPLTKNIKVIMNNISFLVNGKVIKTSSIIYNNTVYAPVKIISESLDKEFKWDIKTNTVAIKDKLVPKQNPIITPIISTVPTPAITDNPKPITTPTPFLTQPKGPGDSADNPASLNEVASVISTTIDNRQFVSEISAIDIIRGAHALYLLKQANLNVEDPKTDYEYLLVKFKYKLLSLSDSIKHFQLYKYDFTLVSMGGSDYKSAILKPTDPVLDANLYAGDSVEGWIAFKVRVSDTNPLIVYGRDANGKNGVWFKGYNNSTTSISITPTPTTDIKLETKSDIQKYLEGNFSSLDTIIGTTNFKFDIYENKNSTEPFDYWIRVKYDTNYFEGAMASGKYSNGQKDTLKQQLKDYQEKLAKELLKVTPYKKLYGGFYNSWYTMPSMNLGFNSVYYYSWTNYTQPTTNSPQNNYSSTSYSTFRWYSNIDSSL